MAKASQRWTRAEARVVIDQLEASGLSVAAFAKRRALSYERVRKWRSRFRGEAAVAAPRLVELVARSPEADAPPSEPVADLILRCPSGHSIELRDVALASGLRLLVAILDERASC